MSALALPAINATMPAAVNDEMDLMLGMIRSSFGDVGEATRPPRPVTSEEFNWTCAMQAGGQNR